MNWWKRLEGRVKLREPLKSHSTFRIGGSADFFIEPKDLEELRFILGYAKKSRTPFFVIGSGSNVLISEDGLKGIVIRLSAAYFRQISLKRADFVETGSGVALNRIILFAKIHSLSGVEFLSGIPGTIGGALAMNAGVRQRNIGDLVENVTIMDYNGKVKRLTRKYLRFGYRNSNLSRYIILSAVLRLSKDREACIEKRIREYLLSRKESQDLKAKSLGCIFKNPQGLSAGRLIDLCGLKDKRIGGAYISGKHANFILNNGKATAGDVLKLMRLIQERVNRKFKIMLEPEIKIWP